MAGAAPALPSPLPVPGSQHRRVLPGRQRASRLLPVNAKDVPLNVLGTTACSSRIKHLHNRPGLTLVVHMTAS